MSLNSLRHNSSSEVNVLHFLQTTIWSATATVNVEVFHNSEHAAMLCFQATGKIQNYRRTSTTDAIAAVPTAYSARNMRKLQDLGERRRGTGDRGGGKS
jgi:hypothetical protein